MEWTIVMMKLNTCAFLCSYLYDCLFIFKTGTPLFGCLHVRIGIL